MKLQIFSGCRILILRGLHGKIEIGPVKARGGDHRIAQLEKVHDILPDLLRRGCRKRADDRPPGQPVDKFRNFQISRPEILPPLGNTVSLIHRHHDDGRLKRELEKILGKKPLRRHIDEGITALRRKGEGLFILGKGEGAVQISRMYPGLIQRRYLILHEGDQRRNHQGDLSHHQGGHLIADGFSRPGGHDAEGIPSGENAVDQRLLSFPKAVIAEILF